MLNVVYAECRNQAHYAECRGTLKLNISQEQASALQTYVSHSTIFAYGYGSLA